VSGVPASAANGVSDFVPTAVGRTPEDREALLQAVALTEAHLADDETAIRSLTRLEGTPDAQLWAAAGRITGLLNLLAVAAARDPELVRSLLDDTRAANLGPGVVGGGA
jgi:hypothetical protein